MAAAPTVTSTAGSPDGRPAASIPAWRRLVAPVRRPSVQTALAGLAGVLVTLVVLPPPPYSDTYWVWYAAGSWPQLPADYPMHLLHHALRLGTLLPTRAAQEVFGPGQLALVATSALFMALFAAGIYATGRSLFGPRFGAAVGAVAVPLVLLSPYFTLVDLYGPAVSIATGSLDPDLPAAGLYSLGVVALIVASRRAGRPQMWWLAAAGVGFGLAYLTREFVAFMFAAIPVFFVLLRIPWRRLVVPAVPMLAILGFELVVNALVYDDPLARLHVASEHGGARANPISAWWVLTGFVRVAVTSQPLGLIFPIGLALAGIGALVFRDRRLWLLIAWFLALWVPLTLTGGLLNPYEPNLRVQLVRYWTPVFGPVVVGGLAALGLAYARLRRTRLDPRPIAAAVVLVLVGYLALCLGQLGRVNRDEDWRELRAYLAAHPEITVINTDDRTHQTSTFFVRSLTGQPVWRGTFKEFPRQVPVLPVGRIGSDAYLQSPMGSREQPNPADGWRVLFRSSNGVLTLWRKS
jgi:hypothetical protein